MSEAALLEQTDDSALQPREKSNGKLLLLSCGHFVVDLYSAGLGALQPLLLARFSLSFFEAGILGGLLYLSSSVLQPVYGYLSDRFHIRWFTILGPFLSGLCISSLGLAFGFRSLLLIVAVGGVGMAAFHPQAAAQAAGTLGGRRGLAMAIFITAGNIGLGIGPAFFSGATARIGLGKAYWAALPGIGMTLVFLLAMPVSPVRETLGRRGFHFTPFRSALRPMTLLFWLVVIRSIVQIVFTQFLPSYLNLDRGLTLARASGALSLFLLAGAFGGFLGGTLADRFGGRRIIVFSMIGSLPFLALFMASRGGVSLAALAVAGLILLFTVPVNVTMAQALVPRQAGTVSALMMGFAWGMAGFLFIPAFGWLADRIGLHPALWSVVLLPLLGFWLALMLPADHPGASKTALLESKL